MSGDEGLREAIARALHHDWHADEEWDAIPDSVSGYYRRLADVTLALPEVTALRAKADAADRVRALAKEVASGHWDWCCARGCAYPDAQHPDPTDPVKLEELVGIFGDDPPPLIEHRTIPCTGACNCPAGEEADRIRHALDGPQC